MSLASIHYKMEVIHPGYVSSSKSRGLMKAVNKAAKNSLSLLPWQPPLSLYQWPFDGHCDELLSSLFNERLSASSAKDAVKQHSLALRHLKCIRFRELPHQWSCFLLVHAGIKSCSLCQTVANSEGPF